MPQFLFEDPNGRQLLVEGDEPPSELELDEMFSSLDAPKSSPAPQQPSQFTDISESYGGSEAPTPRQATIPEHAAEVQGARMQEPMVQGLIDQSRAELPQMQSILGSRPSNRTGPELAESIGANVAEGYHAPARSISGIIPRTTPESFRPKSEPMQIGFSGRLPIFGAGTGPYIPGKPEKAISGALTGGAELVEGVVDYIQSAAGIGEMSLAKTPAAPLVFIKWAKDMMEGGLVAKDEAKEAYKNKDWEEFARQMVHVVGMGVGGAIAAKHGVGSARSKWGPSTKRGLDALDTIMPGGKLRAEERVKAAEWLLEHENLKEAIDRLESEIKQSPNNDAMKNQALERLKNDQREMGLSEAHQKLLDEHMGDMNYPVEVVWGSPKSRKGQYMGINRKTKTIEVYGEEFPAWVESIALRKRSKSTRAGLREEQTHLNTSPKQARAYWQSLSALEKAIVEKIYGRKIGGREVDGKDSFTETDMGYEALRQRIDRAVGETPREFIEATFEEKVDMKALEMMGTVVRGLRENLRRNLRPGTPTQKGVAAMEKVMANIDAAKAAHQQILESSPDWGPGAMTKRQRALEEQTPTLFPIQQDKMPVRRAPEKFDKSLEAGLGTDPATQARLETARKRQEERDAAKKFKTNRVGEEDVRFEDLDPGPAAMTKRAKDAAKLAAMRLMAAEGKDMPGLIPEKTQVMPFRQQVDPQERVGAEYGKTLPRETSEQFLAKEITVKPFAPRHKAPKIKAKQIRKLRAENPNASLEDLKQLALTQRNRDAAMDRPTFKEFEKLHYDKSPTLVAELWKQAVRKEIDSASAERLQQWRKAMGMERNFGRSPIVISGKEATAPVATTERRPGKKYKETLEKWQKSFGEEGGSVRIPTEFPAESSRADVVDKSQLDLPAEGIKSADRGIRAAELRRQAGIFRKMAEKAKPRSELPKPTADVIPAQQVKLPLAMRDKGEPAPVVPPEGLATKYEPIKHSEKLETKKLVSREDFEAKAKALEAQADIVEAGGSTVFEKGQTGRSQIEQRTYVDRLRSALKEKLESEASEFRADVSRETISVDDLDFGSTKDGIGNWVDIGKVEASNESLLNGYLRNQARGSNKDPESSSKRVVAVVDKQTGEVYVLSTYNNAGVQMVADPSAPRNVGKQHIELNNKFKNQFRPFAALLLKDPVKGLRQKFDSIGDFMDEMGTEAKDRSLYAKEGLEMETPEKMEIEGTPGLRTEAGMFTGPDKDIVSDAGLGAEKRGKKADITDVEAESILNQAMDEVGKIESIDDFYDAAHAMRYERSQDPTVTSAYLKLSRAFQKKFPDAGAPELMERMAELLYNIYEMSESSGEFAARLVNAATVRRGGIPVLEGKSETGAREVELPERPRSRIPDISVESPPVSGVPIKSARLTGEAAKKARADAEAELEKRTRDLTEQMKNEPAEVNERIVAMRDMARQAILESFNEIKKESGFKQAAMMLAEAVDNGVITRAEFKALKRGQVPKRMIPDRSSKPRADQLLSPEDQQYIKDRPWNPTEAGNPAAMSKRQIVEETKRRLAKYETERNQIESELDQINAKILDRERPTKDVNEVLFKHRDLRERRDAVEDQINYYKEWLDVFGATGVELGMSERPIEPPSGIGGGGFDSNPAAISRNRREEIKKSHEYDWYLERLANEDLLNRSIPIVRDGETMIAVPIGGSRKSGYLGCAEQFSFDAARDIADQLRTENGFPNVRVEEMPYRGTDYEPPDGFTYTVAWGDKIDWNKGWKSGSDPTPEYHDYLGKQFGYKEYNPDPESIGPYHPAPQGTLDLGPAAMMKKRKALKVVEDAIRGVGSFYDEPMVERIKREGSDVAKGHMKTVEEMQSRHKELYGSLTPSLDPARKAAGAQASVKIPGTKLAVDLPSRKMAKAANWLNEKVLVLPFAAGRRNIRAVEGKMQVPEFVKSLLELAQKSNREIGRMMEPVVQESQAGANFKKVSEHIARVRGAMNSKEYLSLTKTMAKEFGVDPAQVRNIFNEWRREERKPVKETSVETEGLEINPETEILTVKEKYTNQLADLTSKPWLASGMYARNITAYGYDVIKQGPGNLKKGEKNEAWHKWTAGVAKANKMPLDQVHKMFIEWKRKLDKADRHGGAMEAMDNVSQDFNRKLKEVITDIKVGGVNLKGKKVAGQWQSVVHGDLYNYLESAAQRASHIRAFREVFPKTAEGKAKYEQFLEETKGDIDSKYHGDLEALMRTMQGHPTDSYAGLGPLSPTAPAGTAFRYLNQTVGNVLARMVLTGQMVVQQGEVVAGSTPVFLGYHNYLEALSRHNQIYAEMELRGMVNRVMYDFSMDPTQKFRSGSRIVANSISKMTMQNLLNEFQERMAAATSFVVAEKIKKGELTGWEKRMLPETFRSMGFDAAQVKEMMAGDPKLLDQFQRKAAAWLTSGNKAVSESSRIGANRLFNSVFRFQSYPMMKMRQFRQVSARVGEAFQSGDKAQMRSASEQFARFMFGNALQGALTVAITTLFFEGPSGLEVKMNEAADDPLGFVGESFLATIGGPLYLLSKGTQGTGVGGFVQGASRMAFPVGIMSELNDMAHGMGKYRNLGDFERIGKFLASKIPVSKSISLGLAVSGLSQDNKELDAAIAGLHRWKRDKFGFKEMRDWTTSDEKKTFKQEMYKAKEALANGDRKAYSEHYLSALESITGTGAQKKGRIGRSLVGMKILKDASGTPLTEEDKQELQERIGIKAFEQLEYFDLMLEQAAKGVIMEPLD